MTEEVSPEQGTTEAPKERKVRAPAARLELIAPDGTRLKAIKYPMPLKAPRFNLTVNAEQCEAAQTTFGEIRYTYFLYGGASFYVPGHLSQDDTYQFEFPDGYKFAPLKLDRRAQSEAAAKSKAAKAALPDGGGVQEVTDVMQASGTVSPVGEGGSSPEPPEALHEAPSEPAESANEPIPWSDQVAAGNKKSRRAQR